MSRLPPTPWTIEPEHGNRFCGLYDADGQWTLDINFLGLDEDKRIRSLLESAPDMLEELKEIREMWRLEYSRDDSPEGMFVGTTIEKDVAAIDHTIDRAEGRS